MSLDYSYLRDKRIVVTGGTGFLGKRVVKRLQEVGCQDIDACARYDGHRMYDLIEHDGADSLVFELRPQVLIHLAASVGGIGANRDNPGRFFYENLMMGVQLIEAARWYGVEKVVVIGTVCSYPKYCKTPFSEDDLWNGYPEETNAPYGIAKKALLVQLQAYRQQYGMNGIYLIPANLYGPGDNFNPRSSHVIPALIKKCVDGRMAGAESVEIWGSGSATREFLYVDDAAEAIVLAAESYNEPDPINLGIGIDISIVELAHVIARETGFKGDLIFDASKPDGQPARRLDIERSWMLLGWSAKTDFRTGLRKTIDWYEDSLDS